MTCSMIRFDDGKDNTIDFYGTKAQTMYIYRVWPSLPVELQKNCFCIYYQQLHYTCKQSTTSELPVIFRCCALLISFSFCWYRCTSSAIYGTNRSWVWFLIRNLRFLPLFSFSELGHLTWATWIHGTMSIAWTLNRVDPCGLSAGCKA